MVGRVDPWRPSLAAEIRFPRRWSVGCPDENRFIWILSYDGPDGFEARDAAYYDSPERKSMTPDPATLIEKAESRFVTAAMDATEGA